MGKAPEPPAFYTREEAAEILECSVSMVRAWERDGKITAEKDAETGAVRLTSESVLRLSRARMRAKETDATQEHLQAIYKARLAVVDDLRQVIAEQRTEAERKDKRIGELEVRISEMHGREASMLRTLEELQSLRATAELEMAQFEREQGRKDQALRSFSPLAHAIAARVGLAKAAPGTAPASLVQSLTELRDGLTAQEADALSRALPAEKLAAVLTIFDSLPGGEKDQAPAGPNGGGSG